MNNHKVELQSRTFPNTMNDDQISDRDSIFLEDSNSSGLDNFLLPENGKLTVDRTLVPLEFRGSTAPKNPPEEYQQRSSRQAEEEPRPAKSFFWLSVLIVVVLLLSASAAAFVVLVISVGWLKDSGEGTNLDNGLSPIGNDGILLVTSTPVYTENPIMIETSRPTRSSTAGPSSLIGPNPSKPTFSPTFWPSTGPSLRPTQAPTFNPTQWPSSIPSDAPSTIPSAQPSINPTSALTTTNPTSSPTTITTDMPTSAAPTSTPTTGSLPRAEALRNVLQPLSLNQIAFNDPQSPESKAIRWLAHAGNIDNNTNRLVQRYSILTLDYAVRGTVNNTRRSLQQRIPLFSNVNNIHTECSWWGVTCAPDTDVVTELRWHDYGLSGTLPHDLALLRNLTHLDLGENSLGGTIPESLFVMTNLEHLFLHGNNLAGTISSRISRLSNLRRLFMGDNRLTGTIPKEIGIRGLRK